MAKGPKGEYRSADPLKSGVTVMRIALGDLTEEENRRVAEEVKRLAKARGKPPRKRPK